MEWVKIAVISITVIAAVEIDKSMRRRASSKI